MDGQALGDRVRTTRQSRGLTLGALASQVGCGKSYLCRIERGTNVGVPAAALLARLEGALALTPGELVMRAEYQRAAPVVKRGLAELGERRRAAGALASAVAGASSRGGDGAGIDALYKSGELARLIERLAPGSGAALMGTHAPVMVALATEVPLVNAVTAGYPRGFTDLGYPARVADEYVRVPEVRDPDAFACRVVGDSMEPAYREGDVVIFSPAREAKEGSDCFVRFERDAETTFKRVSYVRDEREEVTHIRLVAVNPKYETRTLPREEIAGLYPAVSVVRAIGER